MVEARDKVALAAEGEKTAEEGLKDAKVRVTEVQEELAAAGGRGAGPGC
ncbi:MAG: hypothetical protein IPH48_17440 [bacterium]|nr:hypothetical protein [bacterium]